MLTAGVLVAQPLVGVVVRVAQPASPDARERAARHVAATRADWRTRRRRGEVLLERAASLDPALAMTRTPPATAARALTADRGARLQPPLPRGAQRHPAGQPLLKRAASVADPVLAVGHAQVRIAAARGARVAAPRAARHRADPPEQDRLAVRGEVEIGAELRPQRLLEDLNPRPRVGRVGAAVDGAKRSRGAAAHSRSPSVCIIPALSSASRRSSTVACR